MKRNNNQPYDEVLDITTEYLGPAAKRFVDRQILSHLDKTPPNLSLEDMPVLVDWIKVSVALLTDDRKLVNKYIDQLLTLTPNT